MTKQNLKIKAKFFDLFDNHGGEITSLRTYFGYFEKMPCYKFIKMVDFMKVKKWVEANLKDVIIHKIYKEEIIKGERKPYFHKVIYILKGEIMITVRFKDECYILFNYGDDEKAQALMNEILKFRKRYKKLSYFKVIVFMNQSFQLHPLLNINPKICLQKNYNDDIMPLHEYIVMKLKKKDGSGLVLLHGEPGTGKSTYIRHLIHCLKSCNVIFLPPKLAGNLDSPELISTLLTNPNAILVIEDAEELITSRENGNYSNISLLLNLTDGLLSQSLNIKVICTFNTHISRIDNALLRKGRLIAAYDFKPLSIEKSNLLLNSLGVSDHQVTKPMTLAELYNISEKGFTIETNERKPIGFAAQAA